MTRRVGAAALGEFAVAVAFAGLGAFGLGVAQQHQTAHSAMPRTSGVSVSAKFACASGPQFSMRATNTGAPYERTRLRRWIETDTT